MAFLSSPKSTVFKQSDKSDFKTFVLSGFNSKNDSCIEF